MKKTMKVLCAALAGTILFAMPAFAAEGEWRSNGRGWWWERSDGSYPADQWVWIDGNGDGVAECYHFDIDGYMDSDIVIDGQRINWDGALTNAAGVVMTRRDGRFEKLFVSPIDRNAIPDELIGAYEMHTELVDSRITIERGDGVTYLLFHITGFHEDGSSADYDRYYTLQNLGGGRFRAEDLAGEGGTVTFNWNGAGTDLQDVIIDGMYMTSYSWMAS